MFFMGIYVKPPGLSVTVPYKRIGSSQALAEHLSWMPEDLCFEIFKTILIHPKETNRSPDDFVRTYPLCSARHSDATLARYTIVFQSAVFHKEIEGR